MSHNDFDEQRQMNLEESFEKLIQDRSRLDGYRDSLFETKAESVLRINDSRSFLDTKEEVSEVLDTLHQHSVDKTRILYENVLTGLVKDIFPNDPENDRVHLNLTVKRNQTALSIEVSNVYGHRRDVLLDKGGSVRSIIAIGLRFIALSRTNRRRLVAFDEADRELNPIFIPRFAKMMSQLASRIGMQVIYISHHNYQDFEGHARIIRLSRRNGRVNSEIISDLGSTHVEGWEGERHIGTLMEGAGLTDISLMNVKQHENTVIDLSPLVNVITGTNDIGKSTIIQALECVARNKGRNGLIRDEQDKARVEVGVEGGQRIVFQYKRRGSRKTKYQMYNHEHVMIRESREGSQCPDWLHGYLGMDLYKKQDLHIAMSGSFLLDPSFSDHKRAEILSLNKLCGNTQKLIERHNELIEYHKKETHRARKRLADTKRKLSEFHLVDEIDGDIEDLRQRMSEIEQRRRRLSEMHDLESAWRGVHEKHAAYSLLNDLPLQSGRIDMDQLRSVSDITSTLDSWSRLSKMLAAHQEALDGLGTVRFVDDVSTRIFDIYEFGKKWSEIERKRDATSKALEAIESMGDPRDVSFDRRPDELLESFNGVLKNMEKVKRDLDIAQKNLNRTRSQLSSMNGEDCPSCGQPMNFETGHDHEH